MLRAARQFARRDICKEGDVPVATARPFPFQESPYRESATAPHQAAAAIDSRRAQAKLPVLARIPDITTGSRRADDSGSFDDPAKRVAKYRLDAAHSSAADKSNAAAGNPRRTARRRPASDGFEQLSATIRFGVKAWELVQTYPSALRTVAMFLLTAATGTSMMLMMGRHPAPSDPPTASQPTPTAASTEPALSSKPATSAAETEQDSSSAAALVPTAIGPGGLTSRPPENLAAMPVAEPAPPVEAKLLPSESQPKPRSGRALAARGPGKNSVAVGSYPTTPYPDRNPALNLPGMSTDELPHAQTSEEPAVAQFRGDIEYLSR
jgi:hypothetical protein